MVSNLRVDLRHELGMITSRAGDLMQALQALPSEPDVMTEAVDRLTPTERQQMAAYLSTLAQRCYQIQQHARSLAGYLRLQEGAPGQELSRAEGNEGSDAPPNR